MKQCLLFAFMATMLLAAGCKKDNDKPAFLSTDRLAGFWVPYESIWADTAVFTGSLLANGIFGAYAESVLVNKDHSFIPANFFDKDNINYKTEEKGTYTLTPFGRLEMNGIALFIFTVERLDASEMWLKTGQSLYKFRKQP